MEVRKVSRSAIIEVLTSTDESESCEIIEEQMLFIQSLIDCDTDDVKAVFPLCFSLTGLNLGSYRA